MTYPLHSLANSLSQFVSDELVPMVDQADEGKQKDLAILAIHSLDEFANKSMKVAEMLVEADEKVESEFKNSRADRGINTLHILSESLTVCLEESLQRIIEEAPDGPDRDAGSLITKRIEDFINTLNETANKLV